MKLIQKPYENHTKPIQKPLPRLISQASTLLHATVANKQHLLHAKDKQATSNLDANMGSWLYK